MDDLRIVPATEHDVPQILELIQGLAEYERLSHVMEATEDRLRRTLFGDRPAAEVWLAYVGEECAGFALFFTNYSTFLGKPGLYLEDLFVKPHLRRKGIGVALLKKLAKARKETGLAVITELLSENHAEMVAEYADIIQIGARNAHNFQLLIAAARTGKPIMLKRGLAMKIEE